MISRARQSWDENEFGLFAVEVPGIADLIGFFGLAIPQFDSHFSPSVEIVSFTSAQNHRSRRVMEKIGLTRDPNNDFEHPNISPDNPLRAHVLYRGTTNGA